jgi:hypothetical protein
MKLLIFAVAAMCLGMGAQSGSTDAPPTGTRKSSSTVGKLDSGQKTKDKQDQGQCKSDVVPIPQTLTCNVIQHPEIKTKEEQAKADSLDTLTRVYMWATIFGVVFALGGLGILGRQTFYLKSSVGLAQDSADAANTAANAALANVELLVSSERAIIEVNLTAPTTFVDEFGEEQFGTNTDNYARYGISAMNHGKTVARITHCRIWSDCSKHEEFSRDRFTLRFDGTDERLLGANISAVLENFEFLDFFPDEGWESVRDGTKDAMIRIDVIYQDILRNGLDGRHETSAIFKWDPQKEMSTRLFQYNVYK